MNILDTPNKFAGMTQQEATELLRRGGLENRNRVVEAHLRWARKLAFKLYSSDAPWEDRFQAAVEGLLEAAETFDPDNGGVFAAWAEFYIRTALNKARRTYRRCHKPARPYYEAPNGRVNFEEGIELSERLATMEPRQAVYYRMRLTGLSSDDIGAAVGIRRQAVNLHLLAGAKRMAKFYRETVV